MATYVLTLNAEVKMSKRNSLWAISLIIHSALNETLTDKQKELFEKFNDCYDELTDINEREIFIYAFRLGARIAIEVLLPTTDSSNIC